VFIFSFLFGSQLMRRLMLVLALSAAAGAAMLYYSSKERAIGAASVVVKIEAQNKAAANDADSAERLVRQCYASGGVWADGAGHCARP
jgi:hypothetical protein